MLNALVYTLRSLLIASALGIAFLRSGLFTPLNKPAVFLLGASAAPVALAACGYVLGLVFPGAPMWLFSLLPVVISLVFLGYKHAYRMIPEGLGAVRDWFNGFSARLLDQRKKGRSEAIFCLFLALFVLHIAARSLYTVNTALQQDMFENDRSHYEVQARYFLEDRSSLGIDRYTGDKYGTVLMDDHGGFWPVFIADAFMLAPNEPAFWANPAVDTAYVSTFYYMLLAIAAVAAAVTGQVAGSLLSVLLVFLYRYIGHHPLFGSRDGFRFISLLLLVALVYAYAMRIAYESRQTPVRFRWYHGLALAIACYAAMQGHTGNVYIMLGLFIAFGVFLLVKRVSWKTILPFAAFVLGGTLLGMAKTMRVYLVYGDIRSTTTAAFAGTPVVAQIDAINAERADMETIWGSYGFGEFVLLFLGACALAFFVGVLLYRLWKKQPLFVAGDMVSRGILLGILVLGMLLPLSGLFDIFGYKVSIWFLEQRRYRIYLFILSAIIAGTGLCYLATLRNLWARSLAWILALFVCSFAGFLMLTDYGWRKADVAISVNRNASFLRDTAVTAAALAGDGNVFVNEQILCYYFDRPAKLLLQMNARPLLIAQTDEEIEAALAALNARVFVFDWLEYHDFSLLPFYEYLQDPAHASHIFLGENDKSYADVYVVQ